MCKGDCDCEGYKIKHVSQSMFNFMGDLKVANINLSVIRFNMCGDCDCVAG